MRSAGFNYTLVTLRTAHKSSRLTQTHSINQPLHTYIPQGSGLSPRFFCAYVEHVSIVFDFHQMWRQSFADDMHCYKHVKPYKSIARVAGLKACASGVTDGSKRFSLNCVKTQVLWLAMADNLNEVSSTAKCLTIGIEVKETSRRHA
jgi:hypothetical protein